MTYDEAVLRIGAPVRWMSKNRSRPHASRATLKETKPNGKAVILPWGGHNKLEEVPLDEIRIWKSRDPILNPAAQMEVRSTGDVVVSGTRQEVKKVVEEVFGDECEVSIIPHDTVLATPEMYEGDPFKDPGPRAIKRAAARDEREREPRVFVVDPEMRLIADADGRMQPEWDRRHAFRRQTALRKFGQMLVRLADEEKALELMTAPEPPAKAHWSAPTGKTFYQESPEEKVTPPPEPEPPPPAPPPQPEKVNGNGKAAAVALSPEQRRARGRKAAAARWGKEAKAPKDDGSVTYLIEALKTKDEAIKAAYAAVAQLEEERKGLADRLRKAKEEIDRILGV